ncbi:MAG: insulinase family protein [Bdellovibrionales bacterium]|nr:insulinase family protein [Bdellovibrionales bacterium]
MNFSRPFLQEESVHKTVLENGVRVVVDRIEHSSSVCVCVGVLGGLRSESPESAGITHLLEHVLFRRTATKSSKTVAKIIDSFGGDINGYTDTDGMYLYAHVPKQQAGAALRFLGELLLSPTFTDEDVELEKEIIKQEILDAHDNPPTVIYEAFCELMWSGSQLALPIYGSIDTVGSFDRRALQELRESSLCGKKVLIAAAGAVDQQEFVDVCRELFENFDMGSEPSREQVACSHGFAVKPQSVGQSYLTLGFPWEHLSSESYYQGLVASYIVGEMMSSRLFQKVREEHGLAYDISSEIDAHIDTAALLINLAAEPKNMQRAVELVMEQLDDVKQSILDEEVELAIGSLAAHLAMTSDSITARMWRCFESELYFGRHVTLAEVLRKVEAADTEILQKLYISHLAEGKACGVIGGETQEYKPSRKLLKCCGAEAN